MGLGGGGGVSGCCWNDVIWTTCRIGQKVSAMKERGRGR